MANKKISELNTRTPSLTDLMLVGDPSTGYSYKATLSALSTLLEANISLNDLNDVTITSPTAGQVLSYNGTAWVNDTNGITGSGTTNYVPKFTSSSAIGNSQIFDNGTSVGIATATPSAAYRLDIEGNVRVGSGQILAFSNFNNTNTYQVYNVGGSGAGGEILVFTNGTTERMRLDASGNLIVGGTSALLSASGRGNITLNGSTDAIFTFGNAGAYSGYFYSSSAKFEIDAQGARYMQFNTNGSERMRLDASGNLGIGTSSPTQSLEVNGSVLVSQGAGNYPRFISTVGAKSWEIGYRSGTTNYEIREDGTTRMVIANGGNVGIGTSSPAYTLDVNGTVRISNSASLTFTNTTNTSGFDIGLLGGNSDASAYIYQRASSPMIFATANTERMRITSGGDVGIGTSSPASKLLVNLGANDNVAIGSLASIPTGRTMIIQTTSAGGIIETYSSLTSGYVNTLINPNGGNVGIGTTSPDAILRVAGTTKIGEGAAANTSKLMVNTTNGVAAGIQLFQDGVESWVIQNIASSTALTFGNSGTERLRITGGGDVGIGTSSPAVKLDVNGDVNLASGYTLSWGGAYGANIPSIAGVSGVGSNIRFYPSGSTTGETMRITSGGNVGIGTTSPQTALDVNGVISITASSPYIQWKNTSNTRLAYIQHNATDLVINADAGAIISNTGGSERMRITSGGLVGIGTTTPSIYSVLSLNKNGTAEYSGVNITNANSTANFFVGVGGSAVGNTSLQNNAYVLNAAASALVLGTSDNERMRITSGGNVGIGTTTPGSKLSIVGLPTSSTGLSAGDVWNDSGTLKII